MSGVPYLPAIIVAAEFSGDVGPAGFPEADAWDPAQPIRFAADCQRKNEDPARETELLVLCSTRLLHFRFSCRYRTLTTFADSDPNGRRDKPRDRHAADDFVPIDPS